MRSVRAAFISLQQADVRQSHAVFVVDHAWYGNRRIGWKRHPTQARRGCHHDLGRGRRRHPETQVLSVSTGHQRDYGEGAAYGATDELMFSVPKVDARLANKAEVLVLRRLDGSDPLAIDSDYLSANRCITTRSAIRLLSC